MLLTMHILFCKRGIRTRFKHYLETPLLNSYRELCAARRKCFFTISIVLSESFIILPVAFVPLYSVPIPFVPPSPCDLYILFPCF